MSKSPEKSVMQNDRLLVKTVVSVKATVPLLQYGNIEMFVSQEFYTPADEPDSLRDSLTDANLKRIQNHLVHQILPMVEADVMRCQSVLEKEKHPDAWMQRNNSAYRWLRFAAPDLKIDAMQTVLGAMTVS